MSDIRIGVIGGSGLYGMEGMTVREERRIETPFGDPSDAYVIGELDGQLVAFLPRHGKGHRLLPTELNYRANLYGFKVLGVEEIVSVSRRGLAEDRVQADRHRRPRPVLRPHPAPPGHLLRQRPGGPRLDGQAGLPAADRHRGGRRAGRGSHRPPRRHLRLHGGAAVLDPGRVRGLPELGRGHHRHDQPPGGEARPRGRDVLRLALHGHRLRLLARGRRSGLRRLGDGGHRAERQDVAGGRAPDAEAGRRAALARLHLRRGAQVFADHRALADPGRDPARPSRRSWASTSRA